MIDNYLLGKYLEAWLDNVGRSFCDDETIAEAMSDRKSLRDWGLIADKWSDVYYDHDHALKILRK